MKAHELERWTLDIAERVRSGQPTEDSRVELKREWPTDINKAARRLAGHCNASHGDLALWVIGIDESDGVIGVSYDNKPDWLAMIRSEFPDQFAPRVVRDLNIPFEGKTIVAILFETERAPYLVKVQGGGPVESEVPWREGTAVRTIRRSELLRVLSPLQSAPEFNLRSVKLLCQYDQSDELEWLLVVKLYLVPPSAEPLVIPFERCRVTASIFESIDESDHYDISIGGRSSGTVNCTKTEAVILHPTQVTLRAKGKWTNVRYAPVDLWNQKKPASYYASFRAIRSRIVIMNGSLTPSGTEGGHVIWEMQERSEP